MAKPPRPVFRNIHVSRSLQYRLPPAGIVSILHRISGMLMFLLLPFIVWLFDASVTSEVSYDASPAPSWPASASCRAGSDQARRAGLIWAYLHHFIAGVRHLWMDMTHSVTRSRAHRRPWPPGVQHSADAAARRQAVRPVLTRGLCEEHNDVRQLRFQAHRRRRALRHARLAEPARHRGADGAVHRVPCWCRCCCPARSATTSWAGIFSAQWMKVLTFVVIVSLAWHAWVGMRDIWMDYIKPVGLRLVLQVFTIVWLVGCAGWAVQVLWRL
jgi:succinate dehydrogenase / fumarate reductase cytochrome b subunit